MKKNSSSIRFWHWANMLVICGSLITVLLNSTILDVRENGAFIKSELQKSGASVTDEQARAAAHGLEDNVWGIHIYFGYALAGLLFFRFISELFQRPDQKFFKKLKIAYKNYLYGFFYLILILMVLTGLTLAFQQNLGISRSLGHTIKEVHGFIMYLVLGFIIVHIAGVYLAERKDQKGIVSDMINGGDSI